MGAFAKLATSPGAWQAAMTASKAMNYLPVSLMPVKPLREWLKLRTLPRWRGGEFRAWLKEHVPAPWQGERGEASTEYWDYLRAWQRQLFAGGWAGVAWPREFGGRGASPIEQ